MESEDKKPKLTPEEKNRLLKQQHFWYSFIPALFEIIKQTKNREIALLNSKVEESHIATRFLYATSLKYLQSHLSALGVSKGTKLINLYNSVACFQDNAIPCSSYNLKTRTNEEQYILFNKEFSERVKGFSLIFDIDTVKIENALKISKEIKTLLDERKLPYHLKFSGTRGFHFFIDDFYLPPMEIFEKIGKIRRILTNLIEVYDLYDENGEPALDVSVCNLKSLIKIAYSYDSGNIALPLSDTDFNTFQIEKMKFEYVLKHIFLKNRGLLTRTHNLSEETLKKNVKNFLEEFDF